MKNKGFRLDPLLKFWVYTKRFFLLFSALNINLFLLTLKNNVVLNFDLFNENVSMNMNSVFMFISLVSSVIFVILLHKQNNKPKHDNFIWNLAQINVGCKRAWYDDEFLYIEFSDEVDVYESRCFIGNINRLSGNFKYELESIEEEVNVLVVKPIKVNKNVIEFKKKAKLNL